MQLENPMTFVRSIKGAAASILWAFLFSRKVMSADELERWTGYSDENITKGLRLLMDTGWISARSARGPWCLADGRQLPLMAESDIIGLSDSVVVINPPLSNREDLSVNNNNKATNPILSDSSNFRTSDEFSVLLDALAKYKIVGKKKAELIACEWVTAEYVQASVEFSIAEGRGKFAVGIAINRMLEHVEQPSRRENGHIGNCECVECTDVVPGEFRRYTGLFDEMLGKHEIDERGCIWQDEDEYVFPSGHPLAGQHKKKLSCKQPLKPGSSHWCEEHYEIGIQTYGTGAIRDDK